jgi:predicted NBD/HSP70 family sugar kinase
MAQAVGVLAMEHIAAGLVDGSRIEGPILTFPERPEGDDRSLQGVPPAEMAAIIAGLVERARQGKPIESVGVGFPGIIRDGVIEDSPNLSQMKGTHLAGAIAESLASPVAVQVLNDADAIAAGIAARRGQLDALVRVWTLGSGVGFGRYPHTGAVGEGGHVIVSLDPKETLCGCGGQGHLEGIVGHRSMRLRFLDLEPEEVFASAAAGDARCVAFTRLWHRALAAASATAIHFDGPGRFYLSGPNAHLVDVRLLEANLHDMVKMSPLQGTAFEMIDASDEVAIVGATVGRGQGAPASQGRRGR